MRVWRLVSNSTIETTTPMAVESTSQQAPVAQTSTKVPTFRVEDVVRRWGDRVALKHVSFTIRPGERVALLGASGSGKTTILHMLAGAIKPSEGRILVDNVDLAKMSSSQIRAHRARCGIFQQAPLLVPQLTVHQNVLAGRLSLWPFYKILASAFVTTERQRVRELLDNVGLGDRQWDMPGRLSGGQQQRAALARTLASDPAVLLADEPTAALDPVTAVHVTRLIFDNAERIGATLVFCTHWYDLVKSRVERVIGLRRGKLFVDAPPSEVTEHELARLYAGSTERVGT